MTRLSIIVPTPDGGFLPALFDSVRPQLHKGDEMIVVGDTHSDPLREVREQVLSEGHRWMELDAGKHAWGHPQINAGMRNARGDYLVFIDDDDVFAPDALESIRRAVNGLEPPKPHLFRFHSDRNGTLWREKVIGVGAIGGHQFVVPNIPERLGEWSDRYEGDFDFIVSTLAKWPADSVIWREELIAHAR